jgi:hypothetical protein
METCPHQYGDKLGNARIVSHVWGVFPVELPRKTVQKGTENSVCVRFRFFLRQDVQLIGEFHAETSAVFYVKCR